MVIGCTGCQNGIKIKKKKVRSRAWKNASRKSVQDIKLIVEGREIDLFTLGGLFLRILAFRLSNSRVYMNK